MRILLTLLRKEFILFFANKFLPKVAFIFPVVVILIIPLVTTMDVKHVGVSIVDRDGSDLSRRIARDMEATSFFGVSASRSYEESLESLKRGEVDVILEIPRDFQRGIDENCGEAPHISANGVNGIKGTLGSRYVSESVMGSIASYGGIELVEVMNVHYVYNPTQEYRNNMIPALMIMLLIMIGGFLPALNLVGEKETGTIEQMNVSPVKTGVFVLSKVIPYWLIGVIDLTLGMVIAALVYGLTPEGSLLSIYVAAVLFMFVISGIGILISNGAERMSEAMFMMFFIVMVFVLMSGLMTPISSMPKWSQILTYGLPPRYFIDIMRSVYLKGTEMSALWVEYSALGVFAVIVNALAAMSYRKQS